MSMQTIWFLLQLLHLIFSIVFALSTLLPISFISHTASLSCYHNALLTIVAAYAIVLWKKYGSPSRNGAYWSALWMDESTQYLILATFFYFTSPPALLVLLIPFTIYASFHVAHHTRSHVLLTLVVRKWLSESQRRSWTTRLASYEHSQPTYLHQAAVLELMTPLLLVISIFSQGGSIVGPFMYVNFLRFRHANSMYTQQASLALYNGFSALAHHPKCPATFTHAFIKISSWITQSLENDVYHRAAQMRRQQQQQQTEDRPSR